MGVLWTCNRVIVETAAHHPNQKLPWLHTSDAALVSPPTPPHPPTHQLSRLKVLAQQDQGIGAVGLHRTTVQGQTQLVTAMSSSRAACAQKRHTQMCCSAVLTAARRGSSVRSSSSMWAIRCACAGRQADISQGARHAPCRVEQKWQEHGT